ncbi:hypothetical protein ACQJBY_003618 [Aegilops geniculata]
MGCFQAGKSGPRGKLSREILGSRASANSSDLCPSSPGSALPPTLAQQQGRSVDVLGCLPAPPLHLFAPKSAPPSTRQQPHHRFSPSPCLSACSSDLALLSLTVDWVFSQCCCSSEVSLL